MSIALRRTLIASVGVVLLAIVGLIVFSPDRSDTAKSGQSDTPSVAVAVAKRVPMSNTVTVAGELLPFQEVEVHAKVAGYLKKINVDIGDHVRAGQVLAVLEIPELNAQVQGADATIRRSRDEISRARNEIARAEANHAAVHASAVRLQQAAAARPGLIAEQELDDAEAKDRETEAQVEAAKSAMSAAQQQLDVSRASHLQVSSLQEYSRITAPFDGVVTWRYADTGALVQAGTSNSNSQPLVKLAQVTTLRLRVPVPEAYAQSVRIGTLAEVTVQATGEQFTGKVIRTTRSLDRSTRTMQAEIDVPNPTYKLAPGMYANVALGVQNRADALSLPVQAVSFNGTRATVLLVDHNNRIAQRDIQTGLEDANRVEVLGGLNEGDKIVIGNVGAYQPGELVSPRESKLASAENGGGAR